MLGNILIVGSGHAGVSVAFKLRAHGYDGRITLISDEPHLPYHRPPLSKKYITHAVEEEQLYLKQKSLYERERIELLLGSPVASINRDEKCITLASGKTLTYTALILATGTTARCIPADQGGDATNVHTLRTLSNAKNLRGEFTEGRRLLVVGGGYIGLEIAAVARSVGMSVTLIEQGSRILGRVAAAETAAYFKALHQGNGVEILEGVGLKRLVHAQGRVTAAQLTNGAELELDIVVAGIGVTPATDLAVSAGLQVDNGIVVDTSGRTADSSIYAIGDCACFPYQNQLTRLECVQNAVDMAGLVARSVLGKPAEYLPTPWFWSDQYSTKLQIAGLNRGYTRIAVRKTADSCVSIWYYDEDHFIAVDAINDAKAFMTARKWLSVAESPAFDEISDSAIELKAVSLLDKKITA